MAAGANGGGPSRRRRWRRVRRVRRPQARCRRGGRRRFPAAPQKPRGAAAGRARSPRDARYRERVRRERGGEAAEDDGPPVLNDAPRAEDGEKRRLGAFGAFAQEAESFGALASAPSCAGRRMRAGARRASRTSRWGCCSARSRRTTTCRCSGCSSTPLPTSTRRPDGNSLLTRACQLQFEQVARNSGAILAQFWRNSGAILAQFWRNLRNYISLPTSPHLVLSRSAACSSVRRPTCCTPTTRATPLLLACTHGLKEVSSCCSRPAPEGRPEAGRGALLRLGDAVVVDRLEQLDRKIKEKEEESGPKVGFSDEKDEKPKKKARGILDWVTPQPHPITPTSPPQARTVLLIVSSASTRATRHRCSVSPSSSAPAAARASAPPPRPSSAATIGSRRRSASTSSRPPPSRPSALVRSSRKRHVVRAEE